MPDAITDLLQCIKDGDAAASDTLYDALYDRLRVLAARRLHHERNAPTLTPTALVHEAYLALIGHEAEWNNHAHALAVASKAMRQILVDYARRRAAKKRGRQAPHVPLHEVSSYILGPRQTIHLDEQAHALLDIDHALDELGRHDARLGRVIECRVFGGLTKRETAAAIGVSPATVDRDWARARAYLRTALTDGG